MPLPKTASIQRYTLYLTNILQHMDALLNFYNVETAKLKWLNYIGPQESVNILLNGGKKYNKLRRKKYKKEHTLTIPQSERYILFFFFFLV